MIPESKLWAVGLNQNQFEAEFVHKYPFSAGSIPAISEWLEIEEPKSYSINGVNPNDYIAIDGEPPKPKEAQPKTFYCQGCKKEFNHHLAKYGHEKKCKIFLNTRLSNG